MKLGTAILILGAALGTAWAQNPDVIQDTKSTLNAVQQKQKNDSNAALAASQGQSASSSSSSAQSSSKTASTTAQSSMKTQTSASAAAQKSSTSNPAAKPTAQAVNKSASQPTAQVSTKSKPQVVSVSQSTSKAAAAKGADQKLSAKVPSKTPKAKSKPKATSITVKKSEAKPEVAVEDKKNPVDSKKEEPKQITMAGGRRDPFISPVVSRAGGSGCSTGKRCLAIDQIALQGIVKSDSGMIAVVINALNKAYFLRENDPVFNGYVVKITGDSIIFKETLQDKLGKPFTREVTKKISTPAV